MVSKVELRRQLRAAHQQLSATEVVAASKAVARNAQATIDWSQVDTVLTYRPLPNENEIDPTYLLKKLEGKQIDFVEPHKNAKFPAKQYDVLLMPCPGFDAQKYRLGRGGGWYDRLLGAQPHALKIGLAHSFSKIDGLPHENHDIPLDVIVTP